MALTSSVVVQAAPPEMMEVDITASGTLEDHARLSGNYSMYVEDWTLTLKISESTQGLLVREDSGLVRGMPRWVFQETLRPESLPAKSAPMISSVTDNHFAGKLDVSGCGARSDTLTPLTPAQMLPPGMSLPAGAGSAMVVSGLPGIFHIESCATQSATLLVFYHPPTVMYSVPAAGPVTCPGKGKSSFTYERPQRDAVALQYQALIIYKKLNDKAKADCPNYSSRDSKWMTYLGKTSWEELSSNPSVRFEREFEAQNGSRGTTAPYYDSKFKILVELKPVGGIRAEPGGPYNIERGATVTLDGSRSRPSKGRQIKSYKWKLTPQSCPEGGQKTEVSGARVTFTALCPVQAELTVEDGLKSDTRSAGVAVKARPWKTELSLDPANTLSNLTFMPGGLAFGQSRCQLHPDADPDHYYQPGPNGLKDYEKGSFWLVQVSDGGPFDGIWYVEKGNFKVPRVSTINKKFYPTGSVYELNVQKNNRAQIERLRRSVEQHEKLHYVLVKRAADAAADPAVSVEKGMSKNRGELADKMNSIMREAYGRLAAATTEDKVKDEMRKIAEYRPGGKIYYPAVSGADAGYRDFPSFAELGGD